MRHLATGLTGREDGQAVVEFALVVSLLFLMLLGVMEFGRIMHAYLAVEYASREGARVGALGRTDADISTAVRTVLPPTVDLAKIATTITPVFADRKPGTSVSVKVTYTAPIDFPGIRQILGRSSLTLAGQTVMRVE